MSLVTPTKYDFRTKLYFGKLARSFSTACCMGARLCGVLPQSLWCYFTSLHKQFLCPRIHQYDVRIFLYHLGFTCTEIPVKFCLLGSTPASMQQTGLCYVEKVTSALRQGALLEKLVWLSRQRSPRTFAGKHCQYRHIGTASFRRANERFVSSTYHSAYHRVFHP